MKSVIAFVALLATVSAIPQGTETTASVSAASVAATTSAAATTTGGAAAAAPTGDSSKTAPPAIVPPKCVEGCLADLAKAGGPCEKATTEEEKAKCYCGAEAVKSLTACAPTACKDDPAALGSLVEAGKACAALLAGGATDGATGGNGTTSETPTDGEKPAETTGAETPVETETPTDTNSTGSATSASGSSAVSATGSATAAGSRIAVAGSSLVLAFAAAFLAL